VQSGRSYRNFRGTCCLHSQNKLSMEQELVDSNVSLLKMELLRSLKRSNYTASQSRRVTAVTTSNPTTLTPFNFL
jgi:hypothetical protein